MYRGLEQECGEIKSEIENSIFEEAILNDD